MIIWLDEPLKYSYLRKTKYMSTSSRFPVKSIGKQVSDFATLIGYELTSKCPGNTKGVYLYHYEYYWLKKHDRDISPDGVYAGKEGFEGFMPNEAVDPKNLINE